MQYPLKTFFIELEHIILNFLWKYQRSPIAKTILRKRNGVGGTILLVFSLYYKARVIRTVENWQKLRHRSAGQDRRCRNKLKTCGHLVYNKGGKNTQWQKTVSSTGGVGTTGQLHVREQSQNIL